jgi:YD repeat-containing protein
VIKRADTSTAFSNSKVFDELGRVIRSLGVTPADSQYDYTWDKSNNLTSVKDPRTLIASAAYDPLNRVISETNEESATVTLTRNTQDDITGYQDPRTLTSAYVRNGFGEVIQETSPDRGITMYVRDARGLVTQSTDARGLVINSTYDNAGRLTGKTYPATPSRYLSLTWDATAPDNKGIGRLVGISDESGVTWQAYDTRGYVHADWRTNTPAPVASSLTRQRQAAVPNLDGLPLTAPA